MKNSIISTVGTMGKRLFLSLLTACLFISPLQAYEAGSDLRSSINAGFRLSIPFGTSKSNQDKVKYGLQLSFRRELAPAYDFRNDGHMTGRNIYHSDLLALNFSEAGFKSVAFAGQDRFIYRDGRLMAASSSDDEGGMSGLTLGLIIGAGVIVVIGAGVGAVILVTCRKTGCD